MILICMHTHIELCSVIVQLSYMWPFSLGCDLAFGGCQGQVLFVYGVVEGGPGSHVHIIVQVHLEATVVQARAHRAAEGGERACNFL